MSNGFELNTTLEVPSFFIRRRRQIQALLTSDAFYNVVVPRRGCQRVHRNIIRAVSVLSTFCQLTQSHFARDEVLKYCDGNESVASEEHSLRVLSLDLNEVWTKEWNHQHRWERSIIIFDSGSDRERVAPSGFYQPFTLDSFFMVFFQVEKLSYLYFEGKPVFDLVQHASPEIEFDLGYRPFEKTDLMFCCHQNLRLLDTVYSPRINYQEKTSTDGSDLDRFLSLPGRSLQTHFSQENVDK